MPLALNENQDYIHYRKGSVVMYALKDYIGEDVVDRTLARYDREKAFQQPPYTVTTEFLDDLRQEADPRWGPLIDDLFTKITVFDNRVTEATATKRTDGKYDVTSRCMRRKPMRTAKARRRLQRSTPRSRSGVFARAPDGKEAHQKIPLLEKRHRGGRRQYDYHDRGRRTVRGRHRSV